jgi:hypothetical protein
MARPSHDPDPLSRRQVETLAGYGIPEAEIAGLLGIDAKTLRKHYRQELNLGHTKANAKVAESLFRKATGEGCQSTTAAIFWLKARAGWKETTRSGVAVPGGGQLEPVTHIEHIFLTPLVRDSQPEGNDHTLIPRLISSDALTRRT